MTADHPTACALRQIADVLREAGGYSKHVADLESLLALALTESKEAQAEFKKRITTDKWYWLGMGTIADISLADRKLNKRFVTAYHDLANSLEDDGLSSIYSRDVKSIFGMWLSNGHV